MSEQPSVPTSDYAIPLGHYLNEYLHPMPTQRSSIEKKQGQRAVVQEKPELAAPATPAVNDATKTADMPQLLGLCWSRGSVIARLQTLFHENYPEGPPEYPLAPADLGVTSQGTRKILGLSVVTFPPSDIEYAAIARDGRRDRIRSHYPLYGTNAVLPVPGQEKEAQTSSSTSSLTQDANPSDVYTRQFSQARGIHTTATGTPNLHFAPGASGAAYLGCDRKDKLHGPVTVSGFTTPIVSIGRIDGIDPDATIEDPDAPWERVYRTEYALVAKLNSDWFVEGLFAIPIDVRENDEFFWACDDGRVWGPKRRGIYYFGKNMEEAAQRTEWELVQPLSQNEEVLVTDNMPWKSIRGKEKCDWSWSK